MEGAQKAVGNYSDETRKWKIILPVLPHSTLLKTCLDVSAKNAKSQRFSTDHAIAIIFYMRTESSIQTLVAANNEYVTKLA